MLALVVATVVELVPVELVVAALGELVLVAMVALPEMIHRKRGLSRSGSSRRVSAPGCRASPTRTAWTEAMVR